MSHHSIVSLELVCRLGAILMTAATALVSGGDRFNFNKGQN